jgi:hypothetical protein
LPPVKRIAWRRPPRRIVPGTVCVTIPTFIRIHSPTASRHKRCWSRIVGHEIPALGTLLISELCRFFSRTLDQIVSYDNNFAAKWWSGFDWKKRSQNRERLRQERKRYQQGHCCTFHGSSRRTLHRRSSICVQSRRQPSR